MQMSFSDPGQTQIAHISINVIEFVNIINVAILYFCDYYNYRCIY